MKIVDSGGRKFFADTVYFTREEGQSDIVEALEVIMASLDASKD